MDLSEALELLKDDKLQDELFRLERLNDELAAQIEIKTTLDEVKALKAGASRDRDLAARLLMEARTECESMRAAMTQECQATDAQTRLFMKQSKDEHTARAAEQRLIDDGLQAREAELLRQRGLLEEFAARIREKEDWVEQTAKEYRERATRLKEFAATV